MKLKRLYVDIDGVVFDSRSFIDGHTLHISKEELEAVAGDKAFSTVELFVAAPGTRCRILNMGDIVQPTLKLEDEDATFPGVVGRMKTAGRGTSLMLRNVVISETAEVKIQLPSLVEMTELGAAHTDFAKYFHIVIDAFPAEGVPREDYLTALHKASKKLAKHVAAIAKDCAPDDTEEFTLEREGLDGLPRVAYLADVFCHAPFVEMTLYGESMAAAMPVIIHPNEILDGAVTNKDYDNSSNADPTYVWQNHPIILELYRRHGVDLNFAGVVLSNIHHTVEWKQRNATMAAAMIHNQLRADGCIITKEGGGHPQVDVGFATDVLEGEFGVRTTLILAEFLSPNNDARGQLLFKSKYADAIVSTGCFDMVDLPAADTAIGHIPTLMPTKDGTLAGPVTINNRSMQGCESQMGWTRFGSLKF
ncbi:glycine reductase [Sporobacter termitidis DSM 10068]|uniref:Glycine reductase n=1 Tax=Sporobacter termitidis DSM 10068 TaxID=1123282 RepID=A0A1M5UBQ7_9FIRM|nr:glycine/sarcosine/betaine reductase component B subunit [Sporobacter termitidis]SHH60276.1 glycine reductase [Sporobacter termitidis DSM 10068]